MVLRRNKPAEARHQNLRHRRFVGIINRPSSIRPRSAKNEQKPKSTACDGDGDAAASRSKIRSANTEKKKISGSSSTVAPVPTHARSSFSPHSHLAHAKIPSAKATMAQGETGIGIGPSTITSSSFETVAVHSSDGRRKNSDVKAFCTKQEVHWAKQLKDHVMGYDDKKSLEISDFEYLQHAIVSKGRVDKAMTRIRHLIEFKRRCGVVRRPHQNERFDDRQILDAQKTLNKYFGCDAKTNGHILSVRRNEITGVHVVCVDGGACSDDDSRSVGRERRLCHGIHSPKKQDDSQRGFHEDRSGSDFMMRAIYYLLQAIHCDIESIRAGVCFLVDCEDIGLKDLRRLLTGHSTEGAQYKASPHTSSLLPSLHQLFFASKSMLQSSSFSFSSGSAVSSSTSSSYPLRIHQMAFLNVCPIGGAIFDLCQYSLSHKLRKTLTVVVRGGNGGSFCRPHDDHFRREHNIQSEMCKRKSNTLKEFLLKHPNDFPSNVLPTCWGGSVNMNSVIPTILEKLGRRYELEATFSLSDYE